MATEDRDDAQTAAICAAVIGAVFALGALLIAGGRAAFSVSVGAAIAVSNLVMMRAIVRAVIQAPDEPPPDKPADPDAVDADAAPGDKADAKKADEAKPDHRAEGRRGGAAWGAFALFKILFLFGGIYLLLTRGLVDPIPLVVGYGVLPLGIAASTAVSSLRPRRR
jgi:hypothetical protein